MIVRLLNFLGLVTGVVLVDFQGKEYISIMQKGKFNNWCYVYHFTKVGHVILNLDGTTSGSSSYIKRWTRL